VGDWAIQAGRFQQRHGAGADDAVVGGAGVGVLAAVILAVCSEIRLCHAQQAWVIRRWRTLDTPRTAERRAVAR
jgi:hypothetical protein